MKLPKYTDMYAQGPSDTEYRKITSDHVSTINVDGQHYCGYQPAGVTGCHQLQICVFQRQCEKHLQQKLRG